MIDRLFKSGLLTTVLGLCIIITCVTAWVTGKFEAKDVVMVAGIGTTLLFTKDRIIGIKK